MKISIENGIYNEKRYGKPWIAKVDFSTNKQGAFSFGDWVGDVGFSGVRELVNVNPGDIVAIGQKDFRKPANSAPAFFIVEAEEDIYIHEDSTFSDYEEFGLRHVSKLDAYKQSQSNSGRAV